MNPIIDTLTTLKGNINRSAVFGTVAFVLSFVYIFWIKPGDSVTFGVMITAAAMMLGISVKEDAGTKNHDTPVAPKAGD